MSKQRSKISTFIIKKEKAEAFSFFIMSLQNFFWRVLACRQAEQTKNEVLGCSTWTSNYTRQTASSFVQDVILFPYGSTLCGV
ncbi:hypothetical protein [Bacillus paramycoides]|uniref:hypothetical protein n=1 Tax=Bacillus paramycoides TaxID=2026194 RepID=UPI002E2521E1|nr:hypothetical protein [Bacillus paramycoides]